jgi:hypothetical protein
MFPGPREVDEVLARLGERGICLLEGGEVVQRTGARAKLRSVDLRDPGWEFDRVSPSKYVTRWCR